MNKQKQFEFFEKVMARARLCLEMDCLTYKTIFRDGRLIKLERMYFEAQFYTAKNWQKANLDLIDFEGKIEVLKKEAKTSRDPFWEWGIINLCEDVIEWRKNNN